MFPQLLQVKPLDWRGTRYATRFVHSFAKHVPMIMWDDHFYFARLSNNLLFLPTVQTAFVRQDMN